MSESLTTQQQISLAKKDWLQKRDNLLDYCKKFSAIETETIADEVGLILPQLQKLTKVLDDARKELTRPLDAAKKQLTTQQKELADPIDKEYARLRGLLGEYATQKAKEREEAERAARQAEAEAQMLANEETRKKAQIEDVFGIKAEEQTAPLAVPTPIVPEKAIITGMKQVAIATWEIINPAELDRKFLSPDEKKIRAFADDAKKSGIDVEALNEPGIVFYKEIRMDVK